MLTQQNDGHGGRSGQRHIPLELPLSLAPEDVTRLRRQQRQAARRRQQLLCANANETLPETPMDPSVAPSRHGCGPPEVSLLPPIPASAVPSSNIALSASPLAACEEQAAYGPNAGLELEMYRLTLEEAFYLAWALNSLDVYTHPHLALLNSNTLWSVFTQQPDGAFIYRYAAYHYYRSRGWMVRSGFKFACDFVLYRRQFYSRSHSQQQPRHQHAQYTVLVVPARQQPLKQPEAFSKFADGGLASKASSIPASSLSWDQLIATNRVTTQVQKQLILCYVDIPAQLETLLLATIGVDHPSSAWAALFAHQFGPCRASIADMLAQLRICYNLTPYAYINASYADLNAICDPPVIHCRVTAWAIPTYLPLLPSLSATRTQYEAHVALTLPLRESLSGASRFKGSVKESAQELGKVACIANVTRNVQSAHLEEIFGVYGKVTSVSLPTQGCLKVTTGVAYVSFASSDGAILAKKGMDGGQLDGAVLKVTVMGRIPSPRRDQSATASQRHRMRSPSPSRLSQRQGRRGRPSPPPRGGFRRVTSPYYRRGGRRSPIHPAHGRVRVRVHRLTVAVLAVVVRVSNVTVQVQTVTTALMAEEGLYISVDRRIDQGAATHSRTHGRDPGRYPIPDHAHVYAQCVGAVTDHHTGALVAHVLDRHSAAAHRVDPVVGTVTADPPRILRYPARAQ
ncbi:tRNA splicing endonuclease subunit sen2, partial [Dimargaris verticillata]